MNFLSKFQRQIGGNISSGNGPPMNKASVFVVRTLAVGIMVIAHSASGQNTWNQTAAGTYNWNNNAFWTPATFPNGNTAVANLNNNIVGNQILNLNQLITLNILNIGDSDASNTFTVNAGTGGSFLFDTLGDAQLNKVGGSTVTISAPVDVRRRLTANVNGTLNLSGAVNVGGVSGLAVSDQQTLEKVGGGTLNISGNLTVTNDAGILGNSTKAIFSSGGTMNFSGLVNTISDGVVVETGTLNIGSGSTASTTSTTTFTTGGLGRIFLESSGGTLNLGVQGTANNTISNVSVDIDAISILSGTLNLQNSTNAAGISGTTGTTTLNAGSTGTLTMNGGTISLFRTDGAARGDVVFPANAKLVMNNNATFNFTDNLANNALANVTTTAGSALIPMANTSGIKVGDSVTGNNIPANARVIAINPGVSVTLSVAATTGGAITNFAVFNNTNLVGLNSASDLTILRSQAGSGTLTIGGDGVADVFNGSVNLSSSNGNSRLIKIGSESLTLGGTVDNASARLEVLEGTAILGKASTATVHAISSLIIGEVTPDGGTPETVRIGGSYIGTGSSTGGNYNDQIFRGAGVVINGDGVLDLMGFKEGFNTVSGTGTIQSSVAGGVVVIGENNPGGFAFDGTMVNGGGTLSFVKAGSGGDMALTNNNTYTGQTLVGRNALILRAANGAISGTSEIYVGRFSSLRLDNNSDINNNRVNDTASLILDNGELRVIRNQTGGASGNTSETFGALNLVNGNIIRYDHTNVGAAPTIANVIQLNFASYNRVAGGTVQIFDQVASQFSTTTPSTVNSRMTLTTLPTSQLIGTTSAGTGAVPETKILIGAYGGTGGGGVGEFMTVETVSGVNYVRPVRSNEGNNSIGGTQAVSNIPKVAGIGSYDDNLRTINANPSTPLVFNENMAFNSWRHTGAAVNGGAAIIAEGKVLYLGGLAANPGTNIALDGSGMILLTGSAPLNILGGRLDFNNREGIIRTDQGNENLNQSATLTNNSNVIIVGSAQGMTVGDRVSGTNIPANAEIVAISGNNVTLNVTPAGSGAITNFQTFNRNVLDSVVTGSGGFTKTGGNIMDVTGMNQYSGVTTINDGELRIFQDKALGASGTGNSTVVSAGRILSMNSGVNIVGEDLDLLGNALFQTLDRNNNWTGNIIINPTDASGANVNMTFRSQGNGVLTINGSVTTPLTDQSKGYFGANPTFNGEGESQQFILENYGGKGGIMNFNGAISDVAGASAVGGAAHDELNIVVRGYTGQTNATNNDFVVNLKDVSAVNGRLDIRSGFVNIDSNYGGNNPIATRGATIRLSDGGNVDRAGSVAGLFLNTPGTAFRGGQLNIGENSGSFSSKSVALVGSMATSGIVRFGTDAGSLDLNPVAGSNNFGTLGTTPINGTINVNSTSSALASAGSSQITMSSVAGLTIGNGISGPGIAANTTVTNIVGNVVTLSQNTTADAAGGTNYNYNSASRSAADTANATRYITLSNTAGLNVGDGISGPGIPAGTRIDAISGNIIALTKVTTAAAGVNSVYNFYDASANTLTLTDTSGLKVGMGISGTGIVAGSVITGISGSTVTLSAPLNNFAGATTAYSFPVANVTYNTAVTASTGSTTLTFYSANGLFVGSPISGTNIPAGTFIGSIAGDVVSLVDSVGTPVAITAAINGNSGVTVRKVSNFAESRLYAAEGGTVDIQMRIIDDGGFSLNNEVGAITKVGRGTVQLSGSAAGGSDIDGGFNIFGGTLLLDYGPLRANTRISAGGADAAYQLTLAGGDLVLQDDEARNTTENIRGTLTIRAGNSAIIGRPGNSSVVTLNLGYNNNLPVNLAVGVDPPFDFGSGTPDPNLYWRDPSRFAGGTLELVYDASFGGTSNFTYSHNAPDGISSDLLSTLGIGQIIPYATMRATNINGNTVDFAAFGAGALLPSGGSATNFVDAEGTFGNGNLYDPFGVSPGPGALEDLSLWDDWVKGFSDPGSVGNYGNMTDDYAGGAQGFTGTLGANSGSDFVGVRNIRFVANVNNNTLQIAPGTRLVMSTSADPTYLAMGAPVVTGGAILISNRVSDTGTHDQFIRGGSITSALASTYFSASVMPASYTTAAAPAATSTDLIVHNYNEDGTLHIESAIVNYNSNPLNLVLSGPGTTHLNPTGAANSYTGITFINDSTLWVSNGSRFGGGTGDISMNGGTLEFADDTVSGRATTAISPTLAASRDIILGGDGGRIKTTAAGTTLTFGGIIRSEDNILPLQLAEHRLEENLAVGDLIKEGNGRLILTNSTVTGGAGWNSYYGTTEVDGGTLQLNISNVDSGILGSTNADFDRTIVRTGGRLDFQITGGVANGTNEWIELSGGILGTTGGHVAGSLNGVIKVTANSEVDIVGSGILRLNSDSGYMTGSGSLTKNGTGTLVLMENNPDYSGDWTINNGRVVGRSQGTPLGSGASISIGDTTAGAAGVAELYLHSRTTGATFNPNETFNTEYGVSQNITVNVEGGVSQQIKRIGARNYDDSIVSGDQYDRYAFNGTLALNDNAILSYADAVANTRIPTAGRDQAIAVNGAISGAGNLSTELIYQGNTANTNNDLRITFELNADNTAWTGDLTTGNVTGNLDLQHIVRLGNNNALKSDNDVTMNFNNTIQVGGNTVTMGNLFVTPTGIAAGTGAAGTASGLIIENGDNVAAKLTITQTTGNNEQWDVLFRNGTTPVQYEDQLRPRDLSLSIVKDGAAKALLTQTNTYTGTTLVQAGVLQVGDVGSEVASTGFGSTTIAATGTLAGTGVIGGNPIIAGVTLVTGQNTIITGDVTGYAIGQIINDPTKFAPNTTVTGISGSTITLSSGALVSSSSTTLATITTHTLNGVMTPGEYTNLASTDNLIGGLRVQGSLQSVGGTVNMQLNGNTTNDATLAGLTYGSGTYNSYLTSTVSTWELLKTDANRNSGPDHDFISISNGLTFDANSLVNLTKLTGSTYTFAAGDVFDLFDWVDAVNNGLAVGTNLRQSGNGGGDLDLPDLMNAALGWDVSLFQSNGLLLVVAVPEPSRLVLIVFALAGLIMRRRRH